MLNPGHLTHKLPPPSVASSPIATIPTSAPASTVVPSFPATSSSANSKNGFTIRLSHLSTTSTVDSIRSALPMAPPFILAVDLVQETTEFGRSAFVTFDSKLKPEDIVTRLTGFELDRSFILATSEQPSVLVTGLAMDTMPDEVLQIVRDAGLEALKVLFDLPRATVSFATFETTKKAVLALNGYRLEKWVMTARWSPGCAPLYVRSHHF